MRYLVTVDERDVRVVVADPDGPVTEAEVNGAQTAIDWRVVSALAPSLGDETAPANHYSLLVGARSYDVYARAVPSPDDAEAGAQSFEVTVGARTFTVMVRDERTQALAQVAGASRHSGDATIRAPMPGLVSNVLAKVGDSVTRGQPIVVLEAMKMENDLATPRAGIVKSIRASKGQTVNQGDTLAVIGDPDDTGATPADAEDEGEMETAD